MTFRILTLNHSIPCKGLVLSLSYTNPMKDRVALFDALDREGISGWIIVDLLLVHGNNKHRWVKGCYESRVLSERSFVTELEVPNEAREKSKQFYRENPDILGQGSLSPSQVYLAKRGKLPVTV